MKIMIAGLLPVLFLIFSIKKKVIRIMKFVK